MKNDKKKKKVTQTNVSTDVDERPLDPTVNARDLLGDTSGRIGITTGSPRQTSAEPDEPANIVAGEDDITYLAGIDNGKRTQPTGIAKSATDKKTYDKQVLKGMSYIAKEEALDDATEGQKHMRKFNKVMNDRNISHIQRPQSGKQSVGPADSHNTKYVPVHSVDDEDEEAANATAPDVEQIQDETVLERAQDFGLYLDRSDDDDSKPVDSGDQIDEAEFYHKSH